MLLPEKSLLYPSGVRRARFNPSHPAAIKPQVAAVALGPNFTDLISGKKGTTAGTVASNTVKNLGPVFDTVGSGGFGLTSFSGSTVNFPKTYAVICTFTTLPGGAQGLIGNISTGSSGGVTLRGHSSGTVGINFSGVTNVVTAGLTMVLNAPHFIACSMNGSTYNFLLGRLDNGQILTEVVTSASTPGASDGAYPICSDAGFNNFLGYMATAMASDVYLSMQQLVAWAQDPWSYWYETFSMPSYGAASSPPPSSRLNNLLRLGVG